MPDGLDYVATNLIMRSALLGESGGTISLTGQDLPTDGYYVGGVTRSLVLPQDKITFPEVREYLSLINKLRAPFVGFWVDTDTDLIHFDGVDWFQSELDAGHLGRVREEIAIYDVARDRELRLR